jgi:hypothetical protein
MCRSEDNIKIDFKGIVFKDVDWIQLAETCEHGNEYLRSIKVRKIP